MTVQPFKHDEEFLTPEAESALLGVKVETLTMWRHRMQGPPYLKVGVGGRKMIRYPKSLTMAWMASRVVIPGSRVA